MDGVILERYKKMQGKFDLPHLHELTETFKFEIESGDGLIDNIRMEMSERLFSFTERILEPIISGGDAFCCLFEQDMVTDLEREKLFTLYKKLQTLKWENNLLVVRPDERKTAEWIKNTWNFWNNELSPELVRLCGNISKGWSTVTFTETEPKSGYYG